MSEKPARQPMTDGEREILFQIQQLQAKWFDTIEMCFQREFKRYERIEEVRQEVKDFTVQGQQTILTQMQQFRDECLRDVNLCRAEILAQVRQTMWLNHTLTKLTEEVKQLREQLMKDRLF